MCEQEEAGIIIAKCEGYNYDRNGNGKDAVHAALIAAAINALPALLRDAEMGRTVRGMREDIEHELPGWNDKLLSAIDGAKGEGQ